MHVVFLFHCDTDIIQLLCYFPSQEKELELEQLTKELRQVNLQQFIQQTGTKVTVLPAQPAGENNNGTYTHTHTRVHKPTLTDTLAYLHLLKKFRFIAN